MQAAEAYGLDQQFMFGSSLLVAPVMEEGASSKEVYLAPASCWYDARTGQEVSSSSRGWLGAGQQSTHQVCQAVPALCWLQQCICMLFMYQAVLGMIAISHVCTPTLHLPLLTSNPYEREGGGESSTLVTLTTIYAWHLSDLQQQLQLFPQGSCTVLLSIILCQASKCCMCKKYVVFNCAFANEVSPI